MKKNKIISLIFYTLSSLLLLIYLLAELNPRLILSEFGRLFLLGTSCILLYFGGLFLSKYKKNNKPMKINLWIFFILYCILLITLTLFDPMWGRQGFNVFNWTKEGLNYYLESSVNLIPFKTIISYVNDLFTSLLDTSTIFFNLFGNLICLMPLSFFIPILFKKINNTKKFLYSILGITLSIELIQFITFTGSCDIDDIILNALGSFIMYKILNIKDINNLIKNIFLLEKNKINIRNILKVIFIIFIAIIPCFILYKVSNNYYQNNLNEFISKRNYQIEIIDETKICAEALEEFYEDEFYIYYFSCIKSSNVYARINGREKYLVKDLLNNNPTDYIITIDTLERNGLKFIKINKYEKIALTIKENGNIKEIIDDEDIFEIKYGTIGVGVDESSYEIFIIPKKEGTSYLNLNVYDNENITNTIKYLITIDNELNVKYEEIE